MVRCIDESLALTYRKALEEIQDCTGKDYSTIYMVGGGTNSHLLCQFTANATGCRVVAGPGEATVLGNLVLQLAAAKDVPEIDGLWSARKLIARSEKFDTYEPQDTEAWQEAYQRFLKILQ